MIPTDRCLTQLGRTAFTVMAFYCITLQQGSAQYDSQKLGGDIQFKTPTPTNPLEHNNRGVELGTHAIWTLAIKEAELAVKGSPDNDIFRKNLSGARLRYGDLLVRQQNVPEAIDQYREALFCR